MAYTATVIIHKAGNEPANPANVYQKSSSPVDQGSSLIRTVIHHEDSDPVPQGAEGTEEDRYFLDISPDQVTRNRIMERLFDAVDTLQARQVEWDTLTAQQKQARLVNDWPNLLLFVEQLARLTTRRLDTEV